MYLSQETSIVISIYVHHQQAAILISRNKTKIAAVQLRQPKHRSALITLIKLLATGKGAPQLEIPPVTWHSCPIWQHPYRDEYFGVYILEHHYSTGRSFQDLLASLFGSTWTRRVRITGKESISEFASFPDQCGAPSRHVAGSSKCLWHIPSRASHKTHNAQFTQPVAKATFFWKHTTLLV